MNVILRNPTLQQINETLGHLAEQINRGQRTRLATLSVTESEWEYAEFIDSAGGDAVPNSYRQRAYSSLVSVAWITLPTGERIVRCYAERISSPKNAHGRTPRGAFNLTQKQASDRSVVSLVFPELSKIGDRAATKEWSKLLTSGEETAADWLVYADWLEENNGEGVSPGDDASMIRSLLAVAQPQAV